MHPIRSGRVGFTLIELIVVMAIASLVVTLSLPRFQNFFFADQLKDTTRKILGIVTEFSQEAVRAGADRVLIFDLTENIILAKSSGNVEQLETKTWLKIPEEVRIMDISSVHGGKQFQGQIKLHFSKKGYIDKTYIHLGDEDGRVMTVMLSPFLGVIKIADSYLELSDEQNF